MPHSRTRTGCLTCREDGYKCTEERPACSRCVRLRKVCKGYGLVLKWQAFNTPASLQSNPRPRRPRGTRASGSPSSTVAAEDRSSPPRAPSSSAQADRSRRRRSRKRSPSSTADGDSLLSTPSPPTTTTGCIQRNSSSSSSDLAVVAAPPNPSYVPSDWDAETRYLLRHWTDVLADVVSMTPAGRSNPFLVHLTPMLFRSAALRFAVSAMAASHLAVLRGPDDPSLDTLASRHRLLAVSSLRRHIQTDHPELSLAAILMLQVSDRLFTADTRVDHLAGAKAVIARSGGIRSWTGPTARFLLGMCFYHDILTSVSRGTSPLLGLDDDEEERALPVEGGDGQSAVPQLAAVLRLVGVISTIKGLGLLQNDGERAAAAVEAALEALEETPGGEISDDDDDDMGHTIQAYRHAAFVYLYRVCSAEGPLRPSTVQHAERCLAHLARVPVLSPLVSAHTWPLWTAGCESVEAGSRQFVRDRLDALFRLRGLPSLRRVREDMEEVWLSKDSKRSLIGRDDVDCVTLILQNHQREADLV